MLTARSWRLVGAVLLLVGGYVAASVGGAPNGEAADTLVASTTAWPPAVTRIEGADRYGTSVALSQASFQPGVPVVYVATGANYPDALSGAAAAAQDKGPLLLVRPTSLPPGLAEELTRLAPGRIVVQGGPGAVSDAVLTELKAFTAGAVTRNEGTNRYATALATSRNTFSAGVPALYVATGTSFSDALSASAAAGKDQGAVLLVPKGAIIPSDVIAEIKRLAPARIEILGGPGVVSPQMERTLKTLAATVERIGGVDRYATAAVASKLRFTTATSAVIATGATFPDGLSGGPVAAALGAPLLLVPGTCVPAYVLDQLHQLGVTSVTLLGGAAVLSSNVAGLGACPLPSWLTKTNGWRADYGSLPVREDPWISGNIAAHVFYMQRTGQYGHTEDSGNAWFTTNGQLGGGGADLMMGGTSPEIWMTAPFHTVSLLRPTANTAGYYGNSSYSGEGTDTDPYDSVDPATVTWPKMWPSSRRPLTFTRFGSEWPDPTSGCPATFHTDAMFPSAGLPLIASFGPDTAITTATSRLTRGGVALETCVVTEVSYKNADSYLQQLGRMILVYDHHVITIPRYPLTSGSYQLTVTTNAGIATTTFSVP